MPLLGAPPPPHALDAWQQEAEAANPAIRLQQLAADIARPESLHALVGVQLNVPLSTGGDRAAREEEALWLQDKAQAQSTCQQVAQQVHAAWLGLSLGAERVQALMDALSASAARRHATPRHANGPRGGPPPAPRSTRHAALLLLAHKSALGRRALPGTPITVPAGASNCGF